MIRQPDFITKDMFTEAYEEVSRKKPHSLLHKVIFEAMEGSLSVQVLHIGSFDNEPESFAKMDEFAKDNKLVRINNYHREIYLTDARKTAPEKRKTILRYQVKMC